MIYPSITTSTTTSVRNDYLNQIKEAEDLGIKEVCLFLTCLDLKKRRKLYKILEICSIKKFPLIHLRHDLEPWELKFLVNDFPNSVFNIHPLSEYSFPEYYLKYKDKIYIENSYLNPKDALNNRNLVENYAGVCVDFTHLEGNRLNTNEAYRKILQDIANSDIGCAHIGPIKNKPTFNTTLGVWEQEAHITTNLKEFDYLKNYPKKYFPEIIALEVENSITEQLEVIKYLNQTGLATI